ncbi:MAG: type II secretion system protein GspM, partial [Gammaproteobacteria bacterium]
MNWHRGLIRGAPGVALGVVLMGVAVWTGAVTPTEKAVAAARQELRISEAMAQRIQERLSRARQLPHVPPEELAELERYWQRLERVAREQRVAVARLQARGQVHSRATNPEQGVAPVSGAAFAILPERTEADDIEALDAELNSSLSRFDEMLLKEMDLLRRSAGSMSAGDADGALSGA